MGITLFFLQLLLPRSDQSVGTHPKSAHFYNSQVVVGLFSDNRLLPPPVSMSGGRRIHTKKIESLTTLLKCGSSGGRRTAEFLDQQEKNKNCGIILQSIF